MPHRHLESLDDWVRRLQERHWHGQARFLEFQVALARRELGLDVEVPELSAELQRQESWGWTSTDREGGPGKRRPIEGLSKRLVKDLWHASAALEEANAPQSAHRLKTLALYLVAAINPQANLPTLRGASGSLTRMLGRATVRGYPFEATAGHLLEELGAGLFSKGKKSFWRQVVKGNLEVSTRKSPSRTPVVKPGGFNTPGDDRSGGMSPKGDRVKGTGRSYDPEPTTSEPSYEPPPATASPPIADPEPTPSDEGAMSPVGTLGIDPGRIVEEPEELEEASPDEATEAFPTTASESGERPRFLFRLEEEARGDQVRLGGDFDLHFVFEVPRADDLVRVDGERFEEARRDSLSFDLTVHAPACTFRDSVFSHRVVFENGQLAEPIVFQMKAPKTSPDADGVITLWVRASRDGQVFYRFPMHLKLVRTLADDGDYTPLHIDLDRLGVASFGARHGRQASMMLTASSSGELTVSLTLPGRGMLQRTLREYGFHELNEMIGDLIRVTHPAVGHVIWNTVFREGLDVELHDKASVRDGMARFANAGSTLWSFLAKDDDMKRCLELINGLDDGSRIEIKTDQVFLPWEILNPQRFEVTWPEAMRERRPPQPQKFWGYRFQIEAGQLDGMFLDDGPISGGDGPPFLSLLLNTTIDSESANRDVKPVIAHEEVFDKVEDGVQVELLEDGDEMLERLALADEPWTLIYFFCHGQRDRPGDEWVAEKLVLDAGVEVLPGTLDFDDEVTFSHRPVVVLNSCSSGAFSPLRLDNFYTAFRDRGACGLITTHFPVPTHFASAFGRRLLEEYAAGEAGIGEIVHGLRSMLLELGNPLGLLYAVQCPLEAKAPPIPVRADDDLERNIA